MSLNIGCIMNEKLSINIYEGSEENLLILSTDKNSKGRFLLLSHPINSKIIYSINLNGGHLLLGLNADHILTSIELNIHREDWKNSGQNLLKPLPNAVGFLEFPNINERLNELDIPLDVYADKTFSVISIQFDEHKEIDASWVAISNNCIAKILNNNLVGFWISLV